MEDLKKALNSWAKSAKRVAVLGIGSDLRGDDAAGMLVAKYLEKSLNKIKAAPAVKLFFGATAPENLTGEIKRFKPTHLAIIDSVEMKEKPGTILVLGPERVGRGATFSTHTMPAKIIVEYLLSFFKCKIVIIGIQPGSIRFGKEPSKAVKEASKEVALAIRDSVAKGKLKA